MTGDWNHTQEHCNRRDFLRIGAAAGLSSAIVGGLSLPSHASPQKTKPGPMPDMTPIDQVRIGFVGVGGRGSGLCRILMSLEGVELKAVGDLNEKQIAYIQKYAEKKGLPKPEGYSKGEYDYKRLCARNDLDLVINATPWEWHTPICLEAMNAGKHTATEVPASVTVDQCWQLVETAEKTRRHCVMLENVCYFKRVLMIMNMLRAGALGELIHCEAGYQHSLCNDGEVIDKEKGRLRWRGKHWVKRNGNLYPTHPIGPVAQWMNINRGDRFDYLVSMSSKSRAENVHYAERFGPDHPLAKLKFAQGDINTTLIRTVNGLTVTLYHDTQLPRPYDLIFRVQGTKGIFSETLKSIYIEGVSPEHDEWESINKYNPKYSHPLWLALHGKAKGAGHGGSDFIELYRLIDALRKGKPTDMDVYDAATWSVISELSERSVAHRSRPQDFPDFTRGRWKTNPPIGIWQP